jgi:choline kinase
VRTRAVILAAGRGARLGALTADRPKVLLEVAGATVLAHQRRALAAVGVPDVHLVVGHAEAAVRAHPDAAGLTLWRNPAWATTNMVATLAAAREVLDGATDVLVAYGDIVYEPRVASALLAARGAEVAVAVDLDWERYWRARMDDPFADAESLRLGPDGRILELGDHARGVEDVEGQYVGLVLIRADRAVALIDRWRALGPADRVRGRGRDALFMTDLLQLVIDEGWEVRAAPFRSGWLEFDAPADLRLDPTPFWTPAQALR